jgi:hypothetical protein
MDPKGSIAVHEGARPYVLYVISGTGNLSLNDKAGSAKSRTSSGGQRLPRRIVGDHRAAEERRRATRRGPDRQPTSAELHSIPRPPQLLSDGSSRDGSLRKDAA